MRQLIILVLFLGGNFKISSFFPDLDHIVLSIKSAEWLGRSLRLQRYPSFVFDDCIACDYQYEGLHDREICDVCVIHFVYDVRDNCIFPLMSMMSLPNVLSVMSMMLLINVLPVMSMMYLIKCVIRDAHDVLDVCVIRDVHGVFDKCDIRDVHKVLDKCVIRDVYEALDKCVIRDVYEVLDKCVIRDVDEVLDKCVIRDVYEVLDICVPCAAQVLPVSAVLNCCDVCDVLDVCFRYNNP
jgi:hypothetical protein